MKTPLTASRGSSPLTRGKRLSTGGMSSRIGLIPAHAGKTPPRPRPQPNRRAHPRSRGENCWALPSCRGKSGSSPLTRGKPRRFDTPAWFARLIPAHAGKTRLRRLLVRLWRAHPRSRGENVRNFAVLVVGGGSSPLTRGKHFLTCVFTAQIDQILETLELAASFGSYLIWVACATDAPQDPVRSIGLVLPSSRGAS